MASRDDRFDISSLVYERFVYGLGLQRPGVPDNRTSHHFDGCVTRRIRIERRHTLIGQNVSQPGSSTLARRFSPLHGDSSTTLWNILWSPYKIGSDNIKRCPELPCLLIYHSGWSRKPRSQYRVARPFSKTQHRDTVKAHTPRQEDDWGPQPKPLAQKPNRKAAVFCGKCIHITVSTEQVPNPTWRTRRLCLSDLSPLTNLIRETLSVTVTIPSITQWIVEVRQTSHHGELINMEANPDSQGDGSSYHEQSYYEGLDGSLQDQDSEYQTGEVEQRSPLREQDRFLPIANVAKIMKRAVPGNGKIAKDAKECVQECVSEFISFITSEAAERCQAEKRKTINGEDILCAMNTLGFDNYVEPLKSFLVKYREISKLESSLIDQQSSTPHVLTSVSNTVGSAVLLTPTILSATGAGLTTVSTSSLTPGRQFALINGAGELTGETAIDPSSSASDIKVSAATMASLGTSLSSSLGTTIILPISTQLAIVNGATTTVTTTDQTDNPGA
ncbi:hypothetical protein T265_03645 [Opisthorchis viverrini]|uniref:Transcription factor CBF/NF-Y/archaeal histone domain-containing protein n=1 Tax=Opisthorchis viverrini TaxID=6198 RepID=A0A075A2Q5_OPIVI|nr:hypothetical protein T265_03645 [Opisthorchis viverrini]KER29850.1 hypothetical protein T265_03645 [Opisthorchis viverrini]